MSLERLRFPAARMRGRRYPEPPHPYRNEFSRDRDRIVHARAFRRLEGKTQVFSERLSDHFRNRLTHTIEVAQIARTAAAFLSLDQDFTEALALAHDIGHPPFAHAGEEALDRQMARFGEKFNHNVQALRIVEVFEQRYARFPGLNLTFEVREGIAKHSRDFEPGESAQLDEYLPGLRPPLEAQLIDLADECAYNTADLDDGFSAGLFTMEEIGEAAPAYGQIASELSGMFPAAEPGILFQEALRRLIDLLVSGLIAGTVQAVQDSRVETMEDVRQFNRRLVMLTPEADETRKQLKSFLTGKVYLSPVLMEERERAGLRIARLFQFYCDQPSMLPESHLRRTGQMPMHRVVCDYIAGMTDSYFRRIEERHFPAH